MVANSGAPFNIIAGQDLNGDSIFNDRPSFLSSGIQTEWGTFNPAPGASDPRIPMNFGTSSSQFTLNIRLSKTIGIGPKLEAANGNAAPQGGQGAQRGGGPGGIPGGGRPGGGAPAAVVREAGAREAAVRVEEAVHLAEVERSNQRYSLTFSANARNVFNNVNPAPPIGNLSSGLFGKSTALAGGVFNTQSANRRIDLQMMFSF